MTEKVFVTDQEELTEGVWNALLPKKKEVDSYKEKQEKLLKEIFGE